MPRKNLKVTSRKLLIIMICQSKRRSSLGSRNGHVVCNGGGRVGRWVGQLKIDTKCVNKVIIMDVESEGQWLMGVGVYLNTLNIMKSRGNANSLGMFFFGMRIIYIPIIQIPYVSFTSDCQ